jgi:hypothetical protein
MAGQTQVSGLFKNVRGVADKAVAAHAADETSYGFQRLPGGINNGVAKLINCGFGVVEGAGKHNVGETYWRAAAVVVRPESVETKEGVVKVAGLQTSIMVMCCETKNGAGEVTTVEEHFAEVMNEIRKLGGDTSSCRTAGDLVGLCQAIEQQGPYVRFSTSEGKVSPQYPTPRVFENWHGTVEYDAEEGGAANGAVQDDTAEATPTPGTTPKASRFPNSPTVAAPVNRVAAKPSPAPAAKTPAKPIKPTAPPEDFNEFPEGDGAEVSGDLDDLLARANEEDTDAQGELQRLAGEAGLSEDEINDAKTWDDLVGLIRAGGGAAEEAEPEEPSDEGDEWVPAVGDVYLYAPIDPKTKKPVKKPVECEVDKVSVPKKLVHLRNVATKVAYLNVPWAAISNVE